MHIEEAYFFSNGSCLVNELHSNGTLLVSTLMPGACLTDEITFKFIKID